MNVWRSRLATLRAMLWLMLARTLVRLAPLRTYRLTLGPVAEGVRDCEPEPSDVDLALAIAQRIERAATRLPGESKCLPKAIALQWMLRRVGLPSRLIVAVHRTARNGPHAFHAWVEQGERILIGHCDRADYCPVMAFDQFGAS
ncbi:MAG: lasso peptide biosynthesis B2 protein [Alphaproteobacteria bacterium]|nr:MAG: lasso peptide biosynthesis B2 protein [Alphaproteobacteria bacterium]